MSRRQRQRGVGRAHAFGDHPHAAEDVLERSSAAELDADVSVSTEGAGARQHKVAEPAQTGERLALAAHRVHEA